MPKKRLLLIGWDAADWKVIEPLMAAGEMPNLARLIAGGVRGNLATIYPPLSPMLWTSIATGKRAFKHGIHGFSEPLPDGLGVRPISILSRKTKAMWNILNQNGWRSIVVGWWPSHPAEPINGAMVSNHFQHPVGQPDKMPLLPAGTVHPASLSKALGELRVNPMELDGRFIRMFVPDWKKVNQEKDPRLHSLTKVIAETMSIHSVATELLATQEWDFAGIYYDAIDHFGHGFMRYHPPRLPWVSEEEFAIYKDVIANAYRYHDGMLGTLLGYADENTTVALISDHGFHPDHLRPAYIPAVEHRQFGIICLKGPAVRVNETIYGAGILDICPTILTLCGIPPGSDMDGKVLGTAFKEPPALEPIPSWDQVEGDAGLHPPDKQLDPVASAEAFKQLVDLGYVAPPGPNAREVVDETVCELKYNLARAYRGAAQPKEAAALLRELWKTWPKEHRFGIELIECLTTREHRVERGAAVAELEKRLEQYRTEAIAELARREEKKKNEPAKEEPKPARPDGPTREQFEERKLRELTLPRNVLLEWFKVSQALLDRKNGEARERLAQLLAVPNVSFELAGRAAGALVQLGDWAAAQTVLERVLEVDPQNAAVHAQLAQVHFKAKRWEQAIASAVESLSLLYFQPALHALLGRALLENGHFAEAETELNAALAQHPHHMAAHQALGKLYRHHLNRPSDALLHEGAVQTARIEWKLKRQAAMDERRKAVVAGQAPPIASDRLKAELQTASLEKAAIRPAFGHEVARDQIITVVSGLPRSGTSMMMQVLAAGGLPPFTDEARVADEDNPFGYFENAKTLALARDHSWIPQARGKAIKIVAQLLPHLPRTEYYHVIFMRRSLPEVIASQKAMLARQGRAGGALDDAALMQT